jgi:hypothetical protein
MNKTTTAIGLIILLFTSKSFAQDSVPSVEKSIIGVQAGPFGAWINYEFKLTNQLSLRAEAGITTEYWYSGDRHHGKSNIDQGWAYNPVITAETRWYYNLNKRVKKRRSINENSGNFLSLPVSFHSDLFFIKTNEETSASLDRNILSIVPTWGIRRTIGKHFDYETAIGLGYGYVFEKKENNYSWKSDEGTVLNLHFRIGYHF